MKKNEISEDSFQNSLNPMTVSYLQSKLVNSSENESLADIDLRDMCEKVIAELDLIENETALEYLKCEKDANVLSEEIEQSEAILCELEQLLSTFNNHLESIQTEMKSIQTRSLIMNTSLTNRRFIYKLLDRFIQNVLFEPELIYAICTKEINEEYLDNIKKFSSKLDYIKKSHFSEAASFREIEAKNCLIEPELNKLKSKVSQRVKGFLIEKFEYLNKPKTNFRLVQSEMLMKYKVLCVFLRDHFIEVYVEVCNQYSEIMSKAYLNAVKNTTSSLNKIFVEMYNKYDLVLQENPSNVRVSLQAKAENLQNKNRSIFHTMGRENIHNNLEEDPFQGQLAKNAKYTPEVIFKSINLTLLEYVKSEYKFTTEFFNLTEEKNRVIFSGILKNALNYMVDYFKYVYENSYDTLGILLAELLNEKNKIHLNSSGYLFLDYYFDKISQILWPRFIYVFDLHCKSITAIQPVTFKLLEKALTGKIIHLRFVDLCVALYKCSLLFNNNQMLKHRIPELKNQFIDLILRVSKEYGSEAEKMSYVINNLDSVLYQFSISEMPEEDLFGIEKILDEYVDKYVNYGLKEYFSLLMDFIKQYANEDSESEKRKLIGEQKMHITHNEMIQNLEKEQNNKKEHKSISLSLAESVANDFNESYLKKIDAFKDNCAKSFGGSKAYRSILKKFLLNVQVDYSILFKEIKVNHPSLTSNLQPIHIVMREIGTRLKQIEPSPQF